MAKVIFPCVGGTDSRQGLNDIEIRQTVGSASTELLKKPDHKQGVVDTQREMTKGYIDELIRCAKRGETAYGKDKPYYVCVQTRRERLMVNVIRNQFYHRLTRPTPTYDLALYHYDPKSEDLRFVWCIPDKETFNRLSDPAHRPSPAEEQLCFFCRSLLAGTLV